MVKNLLWIDDHQAVFAGCHSSVWYNQIGHEIFHRREDSALRWKQTDIHICLLLML